MLTLPTKLASAYEALLASQGIPEGYHGYYLKWLRFYLDYCDKYGKDPDDKRTFPLFNNKLRSKGQPERLRRQAHHAVTLYFRLSRGAAGSSEEAADRRSSTAPANGHSASAAPGGSGEASTPVRQSSGEGLVGGVATADELVTAPKAPNEGTVVRLAVAESATNHPESNKPAFRERGADWVWCYDALEAQVKLRHYSPRTLKAYRSWARKLQSFTKSKDARLLTPEDVKAFLTHLAVDKKVSASSQNQAFNALLFLFRHVLGREFGKLDGVVRAKQRRYIPVVLSRSEVDRLLAELASPYFLICGLLYGCGLRLFECMKLRVQDLNFEMGVLTIHDGKGKKDRTVPLPATLIPALHEQLEVVKARHRKDLEKGYDGVFLPDRLDGKYPNAAKEYGWQWLFPASTLTRVADTDERRRYHLHESRVQKAIRAAARRCQFPKRVTAHTLRHSFASHLLQANYDIRTIQKLLGHSDVRTTMVYTQTVPSRTVKEAKSPLDIVGGDVAVG